LLCLFRWIKARARGIEIVTLKLWCWRNLVKLQHGHHHIPLTHMKYTQKMYKVEPRESVKKHTQKLEAINYQDPHTSKRKELPRNTPEKTRKHQCRLVWKVVWFTQQKNTVTKWILTWSLSRTHVQWPDRTSVTTWISSQYQRLAFSPYIRNWQWEYLTYTRIFSNACTLLDLERVQRGRRLLQQPDRPPLMSPPSFALLTSPVRISINDGERRVMRRKINKIVMYIEYRTT
jgi:hypothetical protein